LAWDGRRWSLDAAEGLLDRAVHEMIRAIKDEGAAIKGTKDDFQVVTPRGVLMWSEKVAAWCLTSQANAHITCVAKRAAPYLEVSTDELDADPFKINVANGTLLVRRNTDDLDPISFKPHDPKDLITKISPVAYDPDAMCPRWDTFLNEVQPTPADQRFLHQWMGYSLTGDVSEQRLVVYHGHGSNGKSTTNEVCAYIAGDYGASVAIETFLDQGRTRRGGEPTPDLARLQGVRFLRTSEPEKGAKLAEALIKLATGGEPMTVRHLNRDFFELNPAFKLTISGNYRPQISGADEGIWRRVTLFEWSVIIEKDRKDKQLLAKLRAEASGILNRLLDGIRDWIENGLDLPESVLRATTAYRSESDPCGRFLALCTRQAPGKRVQSSDMHRLFCAWAKAAGEKEWSAKGLSSALTERGYVKHHSDVMWWLDTELVRAVNDFIDYEGNPLKSTVPDAETADQDD
jgi:putative DNA primase/helicase